MELFTIKCPPYVRTADTDVILTLNSTIRIAFRHRSRSQKEKKKRIKGFVKNIACSMQDIAGSNTRNAIILCCSLFHVYVGRSTEPLFRKVRSDLRVLTYFPTSQRKLHTPCYYGSRRLWNYVAYPFCNVQLSQSTELCFDSIACWALLSLVTKVLQVPMPVSDLSTFVLLQRVFYSYNLVYIRLISHL